ncbi:hypothetical protein BT96DRAFT_1008920 [Gymnopus androsaceus JB14]|uniref:Uncharacterized protein n=1 Tax=Gymnopus androsaceus JB14 TaxID=1447944 RepID=A0A6A4GE63_9AGAR|nr:hypothetical protein BT96DRAFT_1008920 [Gymnopus androsaceus JB14]
MSSRSMTSLSAVAWSSPKQPKPNFCIFGHPNVTYLHHLPKSSPGDYPFTDPLGQKSEYEWWSELALHPKAQTLAFLAVHECTGSRLMYHNSALRNGQKVDTDVSNLAGPSKKNEEGDDDQVMPIDLLDVAEATEKPQDDGPHIPDLVWDNGIDLDDSLA